MEIGLGVTLGDIVVGTTWTAERYDRVRRHRRVNDIEKLLLDHVLLNSEIGVTASASATRSTTLSVGFRCPRSICPT